MKLCQIELKNVIYNPATQAFEAMVAVHEGDKTASYPCAITAPASTSFEDVSRVLTAQGLHRHTGTPIDRFNPARSHVPAQRAGRPSMDPMRMLESLVHLTGRRAA